MNPAESSRSRHVFFAAVACGGVVLVTIGILLAMGRPIICECGTVKIWHGDVNSSENSQHISDWYTLTHVIHGFLFYWLLWLLAKKIGFLKPVSNRLVAAVTLEAAWEIFENSPMIINRYREATIALGYNGDSVLNSTADIGFMSLGFLLAWRMPVWMIISLAIAMEVLNAIIIRDNLSLNILMLTFPIDAVRQWQGG